MPILSPEQITVSFIPLIKGDDKIVKTILSVATGQNNEGKFEVAVRVTDPVNSSLVPGVYIGFEII